MPITFAEFGLIVLVAGLHYKYVLLWYGGNGGLAGYWRSGRHDSPQKKLGKMCFVAAIIFALVAALINTELIFFGLSLAALLAHLLLLAVGEN